ncbi:MAG: lactate racemase domain-containing protein [Pirellulaceae bacterium]|nr:lactate racemase domain-containing protein [Pirellulaceae bacterium]
MGSVSLTNDTNFADWLQAIQDHVGSSQLGDAGACPSGEAASEANWQEKLVAALLAPMDAPPLPDVVYPGDCVAISVGRDVPGSCAMVAALVDLLAAQGVKHSDIKVLGKVATSAVDDTQVCRIEHQADDQESLAMVGVSRHNFPIYLNRHLVEADVVIPIVLMNRDEALTLSGSIYPMWSSAETQDRLRGHQAEQSEEAKEAENLVCPFLMVGVIPTPGGEQGEVVAGLRQAVQHYAKHRLKTLWTTAPAQHAAVLATLEAHYELGLWDRLRRAIENAAALSADLAPIILLLAPGVGGSSQPRGSAKKRSGEKSRLIQIVEEVTRQRPIFLASDLDSNEVEELGIGVIDSLAEFKKLIQRSPELAVIRDADRWRIHE